MANAATAARRQAYVARLEEDNRTMRLALQKRADEANPANPVPEPAEQSPVQTTDGAASQGTIVDVTTPGGIAEVAPAASVDVTTPGGVAAVTPAADQDVMAPVAGGTEIPVPDVRTEVVVETSGETLGEAAFAGDSSWVQSAQAKRLAALVTERNFAALRLARLRIQAGLADGEDVALAQRISSSNVPNEILRTEISTLTAVASQRTAQNTQRRAASSTAPTRGVPSLVSTASPSFAFPAGSSDPTDDEFAFI